MFGKRVIDDPFHVSIIRSQLTKHIPIVFDEIYDEVVAAFKDLLPDGGEEWVPMHAVSVARTVVARASNRVFVGLPLCRDPSYLNVAVRFIIDVVKARNFLALFPPALKPIAAKITADFEGQVKEGVQYLRPLIEERIRTAEKLGEGWSDKPNDTLQWMIDGIQGRNCSTEDIVRIILLENFSSTMTTSYTFTHAIYHLAAQPEFIAPLRDEVEGVIAEEGWTKNAICKMRKVDSLLRETLRYNGVNPVSIQRNALKSFSLSDGTSIPKGTTIVTPALATHMDDENYESAAVFDPFRFVQKVEAADDEKHHLVTTAADFVSFGHGRQASRTLLRGESDEDDAGAYNHQLRHEV
ncbi:cytochrome P450 [Phanerochaete sordida]|uniref:Cytochrome P450 n=1 Tax=Phanerochaete sordida TaxID=48140 RepID=A0A9P3GMR3_9APHY|nr:cytochrome P450 [Phanerochaete sordida]